MPVRLAKLEGEEVMQGRGSDRNENRGGVAGCLSEHAEGKGVVGSVMVRAFV